MSADCCLMFARTGSHSEFCPAFEENDPAVRVARVRDAAALAEARAALDERRQERDDAHTEIGDLTAQLAASLAALEEARRERDEARDAQIVVQCDDPGHAERERMRPAAAAFADVLRYFVHPGHPGRPCLTTGWIPVEKVAEWRRISAAVDTYETQESTDG